MKVSLSSKLKLILFLLSLTVLYASSVAVRLNVVDEYWDGYPELFYSGDVPMVSTLDAYKWVYLADDYMDGDYKNGVDEKVFYPDGAKKPYPVPMLSFILAKFSEFSGVNLYASGLKLVPFFAGLFIIPLGLFFYFAGFPLAGIMGGFFGSFATYYMGRTNPGRIDTDCLNLFFLFLIALMILLSAKTEDSRKSYFYSFLAGVFQLGFIWWYEHSYFILSNFAGLVLTQLAFHRKIKRVCISGALFILFSNPMFLPSVFMSLFFAVKAYVVSAPVSVKVINAPNVYETITEVSKIPAGVIASEFFINKAFFIFALAGFIFFGVKNIKYAFPLITVICIGMMSFISSGRFLMFLVPLLGIGFGYLINHLVNIIKIDETKRTVLLYGIAAAVVLSLFLSQNHKGLTFTGRALPSVPVYTYEDLLRIKKMIPEDSSIYTWWDHGLAIRAITGFKTFHDGMNQSSPKTWLIAKSLISKHDEFANILAFISNEGAAGIYDFNKDNASFTTKEALSYMENYSEPVKDKNIYVLFTDDMIRKFQAIEYLGSWNVGTGTPGGKAHFGIIMNECDGSSSNIAVCGKFSIDQRLGLIDGKLPLKRIDFVDATGEIYNRLETGFDSMYYAVMLRSPDSKLNSYLLLMQEAEYNSAFVQMFILGNYDPYRFKEIVLNAYPATRLYQVLK